MADPKAMIPVVDPETGKTGYIDPKFAPEAQRTGLQGATDTQLREAQLGANAEATRADLNKEFDGTIEGYVAPALAGAARGLTLGGSDVLAGKLGPGVRRRLLDYQDYAPGASMAGEFGAIAGAALLGDEAGIGRLPGLVGKLGAGAESAVASRLGGGMLARGAGLAARGAAEGAIYSEGKAAGDAALHNEDLTAEKAMAAAGHGALFGAGANVLLGGAGAGLSRLMRRESGEVGALARARIAESPGTSLGDTALEDIEQVTKPGRIKLSDIEHQEPWEPAKLAALEKDPIAAAKPVRLTRSDDGTKWVIDDGIHRIARARAAGAQNIDAITTEFIPRAAKAGEAGALGSRVEGGTQREATGLGDAIQSQRDRHVFKALGGTKGDVMAAERNVAGGYRKVADDVFNVVESKGERFLSQSKKSINDIVTAEREASGARIGDMFKKLDESGSGLAPDIRQFVAEARAKLVAPHQIPLPDGSVVARPAQAESVHEVEKFLKQVEAAYSHKPPTFSQWHEDRVFLDKSINFAKVKQSPAEEALTKLRGIMEGHLDTSAEAAAKNIGSSFSDAYQAEKSLYQSMRIAQNLSDRGVAGQVNNNSFGLGATIGAAAGMATGGPIGGLAMGLAGKLIKDRGDMLAADLLHRAANVAGVQRLASKTDMALSSGVAGLLGTKPLVTGATEAATRSRSVAAPLGVTLSGDLHKDFDKVRAATVQLSTNPMLVTDKVAKALGPEAAKSPALAAAFTRTMVGDVAYLASKLPPPRTDQFTLQPHLQPETRASDAAKHEFLESAKALDDPTIMLRQAKAGALTPITVETLKERRPEMYAEMRTMIAQSLATSTKELPYGQRVQLGILLKLPTDQTLAPDFVRDIQATYTASEKAGVEPPPPQLSSLDVSGSLMTSTQSAGADGKVS